MSKRMVLLSLIDVLLVNLALLASLLIRYDGVIPAQYWSVLTYAAPLYTVIRLFCFHIFGLYNRLWRYASVGELVSICLAVLVGTVVATGIGYGLHGSLMFHGPVLLMESLLVLGFVGGSRLALRLMSDHRALVASRQGKEVLIYGAGDAGVLVAKDLVNHDQQELRPVGFIDDDPDKQNMKLLGYPVLGNRQQLSQILADNDISEIIIAMPSVSGRVIQEIVLECQSFTDVEIRILPPLGDFIDGKATINTIREVQVEDLLNREPVQLDMGAIQEYLEDRVVLVTGGGGSIGSELCRQVAGCKPRRLMVLDQCENSMYQIERELRASFPDLDLMPVIMDVCDLVGTELLFRRHRPEIVFHAAAHKHVPLMEENSEEAIKNNVLGTLYVGQAAVTYKTGKFILVSTDKAVNPTSIMGATKRLAEMVVLHMNGSQKQTRFAAVRFGNVLGSRGSVVPLFKEQIAKGGPVTVTHKDIIRYFMTIPEAVQLVLQAGALTNGGEVFALDMGDQVKIWDLAHTLIRLSGLEPGVDIEVVETGLRPGEKLYEELLTDKEKVVSTEHERIYVAVPELISDTRMREMYQSLSGDSFRDERYPIEDWIRKFMPYFRCEKPQPTDERPKLVLVSKGE